MIRTRPNPISRSLGKIRRNKSRNKGRRISNLLSLEIVSTLSTK
jgi:hypothetical protein